MGQYPTFKAPALREREGTHASGATAFRGGNEDGTTLAMPGTEAAGGAAPIHSKMPPYGHMLYFIVRYRIA